MENKKTFVENDLQEFCKKLDTNIDKIVYEESKYYQNEAVITFYKNGRKVVTNVTDNSYGTTAYYVLKDLMYQEIF